MYEKWQKELFLRENLYLGDLINKPQFIYYYKSEFIQNNIDNLDEFTSDKDVYLPILIAGNSGSGKTSLIRFMDENKVFKGYTIIINLNKYIDNKKSLYKYLLLRLEAYFFDFQHINDETQKLYNKFQINKRFVSDIEKIRDILYIHNSVSKIFENRQEKNYDNLIIILDEIDMLSIKDIEKYTKEIFSILEESKYIHKIICARHDTLKYCRAYPNSFFATMFRRQIEVMPEHLRNVIEKRLECASSDMEKTKIQFDKYFDKKSISLIEEISSDNIRYALDFFSKFFKINKPQENINPSEYLLNFLMKNHFIPNINEILFMEDGLEVPCVRIVLEALFKRNSVDKKFIILVNKSIMDSLKNENYCKVLTKENIQRSIKQLKEFLIIDESVYNSQQYDLTKKGKLIYKILKEKNIYNRIFPFKDEIFSNFFVSSL